MAKEKLTVQNDITVAVRELDFVTRFGRNWDSLREILGIMRPIRKTPGTKLTSYKASMKDIVIIKKRNLTNIQRNLSW